MEGLKYEGCLFYIKNNHILQYHLTAFHTLLVKNTFPWKISASQPSLCVVKRIMSSRALGRKQGELKNTAPTGKHAGGRERRAVGLFCSLVHRKPDSGPRWLRKKNRIMLTRREIIWRTLLLVSSKVWVSQQDNDPKQGQGQPEPAGGWGQTSPAENPGKVLKVSVRARKIHNLEQPEQFATEDWTKIPQETCEIFLGLFF